MLFCKRDISGSVLQFGGFIWGLYCWRIQSVSATFEMSNSDIQRPMETEGGRENKDSWNETHISRKILMDTYVF